MCKILVWLKIYSQNYCLFFGDVLLHTKLTDCHQVKAKRVAHIVTASNSNLSPVAHEISSAQPSKGGKFTEDACMDISFLRLPSHIQLLSSCFPAAVQLSPEVGCGRGPALDVRAAVEGGGRRVLGGRARGQRGAGVARGPGYRPGTYSLRWGELLLAGMLLTRDSLLLHKEFCLRDIQMVVLFFSSFKMFCYVSFMYYLYYLHEWKVLNTKLHNVKLCCCLIWKLSNKIKSRTESFGSWGQQGKVASVLSMTRT